MVFYLLCKILVPILDTVYLAEIIKLKKKHFELFPILESGGSIGEKNRFLIWRLVLRHFTFQRLSLGNIGSSGIFLRETEGSNN